MAKRAKSKKYTTINGLNVTFLKVNKVKMQRLMNKVKMPDPPTYTATTFSGRKEVHIMDDEAAKTIEGGKEQMKEYNDALEAAKAEQNRIIVDYILLAGVKVKIEEDEESDELFAALGVKKEKDPLGEKLDYLYNNLEEGDIAPIVTGVMDISDAPEEVIKELKGSFPSDVREESGRPEDMVIPG